MLVQDVGEGDEVVGGSQVDPAGDPSAGSSDGPPAAAVVFRVLLQVNLVLGVWTENFV